MAEIIYHTYDGNRINLLNTQEEDDVTSINSINETNDIFMNCDEKYTHKYDAQFLSSKNHEDVSYRSEYISEKRRFFTGEHCFGFIIK